PAPFVWFSCNLIIPQELAVFYIYSDIHCLFALIFTLLRWFWRFAQGYMDADKEVSSMLKGILAIVIGFLLVKAFCDTVLDIFFKNKK
ncbi:MAG: hypothetical protein IKH90_07820, partial [Ruminococcus sp.]|nr:hypothetical protein [Ruminococcus sp.]